jgi:transposase
VQDESRFGLFTKNGRGLTAKGIKPICPYQQKFSNTYLYGAFSPITGDSFLTDMPNCNSECFQIFLNEFSMYNPKEFKIIVLDNGAFHKAKTIIIPDNIKLIFLPPYSPELNPAETVWLNIKRIIINKTFKTLEELQKCLHEFIQEKMDCNWVKSICAYKYLMCLNQTII